MKIAVLGAGTVGKSWTSLFLSHGFKVNVYDPFKDFEFDLIEFIDSTRDTFDALGFNQPNLGCLQCSKSAVDAVEGATLIQENIPENLLCKHLVYSEIEPHLAPHAIVLSSTSGFTLTELQCGFKDPSRIVIAHPFNPPHLIPLVEIVGNAHTKPDIVQQVMKFYKKIGKTPIELKKSVPGHIANRLQAVIWQEALYLAKEGVASLEDIDKAISAGPGLRWSIFGPNQLFALAAGESGLNGFIDHLGASFQIWWTDAGQVKFDEEMCRFVADSDLASQSPQDLARLIRKRDKLLAKFVSEKEKFNG